LRRNILGEKEAVSPVIAIILMVAITVVLAATLWIMLDADEEIRYELYGSMERGDWSRSQGYVRVDIGSMNPSSLSVEEVTVRLYDEYDEVKAILEGELENTTENDDTYTLRWARTDDTIDSTSRLYVEYGTRDDAYDFEGYEIVISADDYTGSLELVL